MKKKISILVAIGCLLILVNMGIVGISAALSLSNNGYQVFNMGKDQVQIDSYHQAQTIIPHADANGPYSAGINEPITFSGLGSCTGFYTTYKWDFGDGTTGFGKYPTHSYSEAGEYYVTLKVTTANNKVYLDDTLVYIDQENDHLLPNGGCFYHADVDETITFDASESVSNDPNLPIVEYNWYFSDGTKKSGQKVTHSFEENRVYMVTLYVKDSEGNVRRDILHADIGHDYTNKWDFFLNVDNKLQQMLETLFDGFSEYLLNYLDAKIYTNYNGIEKLVELNSLSQLPLYINVNDEGADDVILNDMEVLNPVKGPSLFGEGMDWWQFETTLSNIEKTDNSDIKAEDDFTICLQINFGATLAGWLGLDTPIVRIGYNSPSGQEMPNSISFTHIFKPYFMQRWQEIIENAEVEAVSSEANGIHPSGEESNMGIVEATGVENIEEIGPTDFGEDLYMQSEEMEGYQPVVNSNPYDGLEDEYWPEYGLRLDSSGGDEFSLVRMFLKSESNSNTGLFLSISLNPNGDESTYLVYKAKKEEGVFYRGLKFEIPGDAPTISFIRKDNGVIKTELSTGLFLGQDKTRKIIWDDAGISIRLESDASTGLQNFYFDNEDPEITITLDEITFDFSGVFELSLSEGIDLKGEAGFSLTNLDFKASNFNAGITGTLSIDITSEVNIGLYKEGTEVGLKIGFTDALILSSDCIYEINGFDVILKGVFSFNAAESELRFAIDNEIVIIRLEQGPSVEINNFYFKVGDLTVAADYVNIGPDSEFQAEWDTSERRVRVSGGTGSNIVIENVNVILSDLEVMLDGHLDIDADVWIEFKPYTFGTGFIGMLNIDCTITMKYLWDQQIVTLGGDYTLHTGGSVWFNWEDQIEITVSGGTGLTIDDFLFEIGDLSASAKHMAIDTNSVVEFSQSGDQFILGVGGGVLLSIQDIVFSVTNIIDLNTIGTLDVSAGGSVTFASTGIGVSVDGSLELSEGFEFTFNQITVGISGNVNANGDFSVTWNSNSFTTAIDGNCNWDIILDTVNLGVWETIGDFNADLSITTQKITDGGLIQFNIYGSGIQNNLKVIHGDLTVELGAFNLDPGSIEFEWHKEGSGQPGTLDISNSGVSGTLASCKITYTGSDPIEIQLGSISSSDGTANIIWYKDATPNYIEIDSSISLDVDPLKFTWGSKVLTFDALELEQGKFYLGWDDSVSDTKEITIKNSIANFGPGVSYEDTSQDLKLSASLGGLNDEYNTITLKTYKDSNGDISGLYLDSGGEQLATWIQLEAIKGESGRRIELDGLKVQGFYINKTADDTLEWGGKIWLVNGLVFSKTVTGDTWMDLEVNWNLAAEGEIEFIIDDGFEDDWEIDTTIKGVEVEISVTDVANYVRFGWDLKNPLTTSGYVQIDTNSESISEIDLRIWKNNLGYYPLWGLHTYATGLAAEDYQIYWYFFAPPGEWILYESGWLQPGSIQDLDIGFLGNWYVIFDGGTRI